MGELRKIRTRNVDATVRLGRRFGRTLKPDDVVLLSGPPGAGKTWFTKGIAKSLGVRDLVNSPSFSIINEYSGKIPFFHFDLYRLRGCGDVSSLGCEEYFQRGGVCVFEWPERCPSLFEPDHIRISITVIGHDQREFIFSRNS
jgi:tRNA threonylcarbamoyladenosine biosynthesis protein TsaE